MILLVISSFCILPVSAVPTADELGGFTVGGLTKEAAITVDGVYYKLKEDGTAAVCGAPEGLTKFIVPTEVEGLKVTELSTHHQRFPGSSTIKTLIIPEGIEVINGSLNMFMNVTEIELPSTLTKITNIDFFDNTAFYKDKSK